MILYNIQHHGDTTWLPWLLQMLQHPQNRFLVTYDGPLVRADRLARDLAALPLEARSLAVEPSLPIRWCGPSQAMMLEDVLRRAVAIPGWDFFINLSGTCAPLLPQPDIAAHLGNRLRDGITAHFFSFPVRKPPVMPLDDPEADPVQVERNRLTLRGNPALVAQFVDPEYLPVRNPANRLYVACREPDDDPGVLEIARPDPVELAFRTDYLARVQHHCGRAWFVFHRSACEALVRLFDQADFAEAARLFYNCFEPDESFLQTLIMNRMAFPLDQVSPDNLRAFKGRPQFLHDDNMDDLKSETGAFFARKINHGKAAALRTMIETRTGRKPV